MRVSPLMQGGKESHEKVVMKAELPWVPRDPRPLIRDQDPHEEKRAQD
jgi:hypothetical protein